MDIEPVTVDWLRQMCGLPDTAGGLFVSGGTAANLTALAVACHARLGDRTAGAVVYYLYQTHAVGKIHLAPVADEDAGGKDQRATDHHLQDAHKEVHAEELVANKRDRNQLDAHYQVGQRQGGVQVGQ